MEKLIARTSLRIVATLLLWAAAAFSGVAQRHYEPHIHLGVHGGASLSTVAFYPSVKQSMLPGTYFGATFRYAEERHVGLMAELNFVERGWKENFEEGNAQFAYQHRTSYVSLPIMTHIFFGSRVVKGFFNLGPEIGYMLSDRISSNFDYVDAANLPFFRENYRQTAQMDLKIKNRFDYGITAGAGIEFIIKGKHAILLEGRYYFGLGNLFGASKKDEFSASRNSSILISAGYMFRVK